jgi:Zn-dependent M28 family amino/carboxypeptidase
MIRPAVLAGLLLLAGVATGFAQAPDPYLWSGQRALADIAKQLSFGRRSLDQPGHEKTLRYIEQEMARLGIKTQRQHWADQGARGTHNLTNLVARFDPANPRRLILGTHYDSIARAYADKKTPDAPMPGANNSASGVALLLETARVLSAAPSRPPVGVDFVFFDGEEGPVSLGAGDPQWQALGSPYFVQHLNDFYPQAKPLAAAIFDMVCYRDLRLPAEPSSVAYARSEVEKFWSIGNAAAPRIFVPQVSASPVYDDQNALADAGIPSFLVIGFDYAPWFNTTQDTIDKCSAASLEAVGRTTVRYVYLPR